MIFVKTENLKTGMRLAKPIYNKNGVLLYDRNSKLTLPGINSVRNFGLIGVYILEPAEPLPPLSREDLEFEQLQTIYFFRLREILDLILKKKPLDDFVPFLEDIIRKYGSLSHRVNFNQNHRSSEDFLYKHAISTAILVTMMTSRLGYSHEKQLIMVASALLYDIGYRYVPKVILEKGDQLEKGDRDIIQQSLEKGLHFLSAYQNSFDFMPQVSALCAAYIYSTNPNKALTPDSNIQAMMGILRIADNFDQLTAMNLGHEPKSELMAMEFLKKHPDAFEPKLVSTLAECIHIAPHAASVDLANGNKGIILVENPVDYLHPVILNINDNKLYDLSDPSVSADFQIVDIMKTMDNRVHISPETIKNFIPDNRLKEITKKFNQDLTIANVRKKSSQQSLADSYH
ncbi:MAG: HD domain-containing phosphohydrolase [Agathobacter sp.]